jgi:ribonuclease-3
VTALANLATLQQVLGVRFKDPSLLEQTLVHSSYINENPGAALTSNERLEFLGDAVLGMIFAQKLYHYFPNATEGEMTKLRSALVRRSTLNNVAKTIGLSDYLYLGKGEEAGGGRHKPTNLAGALEAVTAAIFLDQGWDTTTDFILRLFDTELKKLDRQGAGVDYKSQLQHLVQSEQQETPIYQIIETTGPAHDRMFTAEVRVSNTVLGRGSGKSKKLAETEAARSALKSLNNFTQ